MASGAEGDGAAPEPAAAALPSRADPERISCTAIECERSSLRIERSSWSVTSSPVERLYKSSTSSSSAASRAASRRSTGAIRVWRRSHSGTRTLAGSGISIPSSCMRASSRRRCPLSASAIRRRMSASRSGIRWAMSSYTAPARISPRHAVSRRSRASEVGVVEVATSTRLPTASTSGRSRKYDRIRGPPGGARLCPRTLG